MAHTFAEGPNAISSIFLSHVFFRQKKENNIPEKEEHFNIPLSLEGKGLVNS